MSCKISLSLFSTPYFLNSLPLDPYTGKKSMDNKPSECITVVQEVLVHSSLPITLFLLIPIVVSSRNNEILGNFYLGGCES